jgi:hypothetical protein
MKPALLNTEDEDMTRRLLTTLITLALSACAPDESSEVDHAHDDAKGSEASDVAIREGLGTHHMRITTTSDSAQMYFDQGLRLSYAFNHPAAIASFRKAAAFDPECAMCYWGVAWASGPNINAALTPEGGAAAHQAVHRALELAGEVTGRRASGPCSTTWRPRCA